MAITPLASLVHSDDNDEDELTIVSMGYCTSKAPWLYAPL